jgi:hypothetical protein
MHSNFISCKWYNKPISINNSSSSISSNINNKSNNNIQNRILKSRLAKTSKPSSATRCFRPKAYLRVRLFEAARSWWRPLSNCFCRSKCICKCYKEGLLQYLEGIKGSTWSSQWQGREIYPEAAIRKRSRRLLLITRSSRTISYSSRFNNKTISTLLTPRSRGISREPRSSARILPRALSKRERKLQRSAL